MIWVILKWGIMLWAPGVFYSDTNAARQNVIISQDTAPLFKALKAGRVVVFPLDGIGTGLADLERRAPTTFSHPPGSSHDRSQNPSRAD